MNLRLYSLFSVLLMMVTGLFVLAAPTEKKDIAGSGESVFQKTPINEIVSSVYVGSDWAPVVQESYFRSHIRGITLAPIEDRRLGPVGYGSDRSAIAINEIADVGGTWISITPFGRMDDLESPDILPDFEIPIERNVQLVLETARQAREAGLHIAIIPHVYVMSGEWRGQIDMETQAKWDTWFEEYTRYLLRWAEIAQEVDAELLSIGVEFKSSTNFQPLPWRALIAKVRTVYKGALTYSANWDEADQVPFWDALDYIGINAFWPLADKPGDGFEKMQARSALISDELAALSFYFHKPILFTEMGIKSASDTALAPWEWPEHCGKLNYDEQYQAMAYQAIFESMAPNPWFAGLFIWKYFSDPYDETQEERAGFSPKRKSAEIVLERWFKRSWDENYLSLWPS